MGTTGVFFRGGQTRQHFPQTMQACGRDEIEESFEPSGFKSMFGLMLALSAKVWLALSHKKCIP